MLPDVPYDATAQRPSWDELPAAVRNAVVERLGGRVIAARTAGGGFTRGFAAVLDIAGGDRAFVKASREDSPLAYAYAREAEITAVLPTAVPAPRLRWTMAAAGWYAICLEAVDGQMPGLPWNPAELTAALDAHAAAAAALAEPPSSLVALGLPTLEDIARDDLSRWQEIAAHRAPVPAMPRYGLARLDELAALEAALPSVVDSSAVMHCDLRLDNIIVDRAGCAWICDWNWLCHGPAWVDTVSLLVTAYASDLDADALLAAHPTARGVPAEAVDAALAALAGHYLVSAGLGDTGAAPALRTHQRWTGGVTLRWLAERRGWGVLAGPQAAW
jgi:aminoglycoside phosphotransferase (APT) family kinase protein